MVCAHISIWFHFFLNTNFKSTAPTKYTMCRFLSSGIYFRYALSFFFCTRMLNGNEIAIKPKRHFDLKNKFVHLLFDWLCSRLFVYARFFFSARDFFVVLLTRIIKYVMIRLNCKKERKTKERKNPLLEMIFCARIA